MTTVVDCISSGKRQEYCFQFSVAFLDHGARLQKCNNQLQSLTFAAANPLLSWQNPTNAKEQIQRQEIMFYTLTYVQQKEEEKATPLA